MTDLKYTMTDRMRDAIANSDWMDVGRVDPETIALGYEYFDRWLNEERAKAYDEGKTAMAIYSQGARMKVPYPENPYRKADS